MTHEQHLATLKPSLREILTRQWTAIKNTAAVDGFEVRIICSARTQAEQDALFAQGRTKPGPRVTWTRNSRHLDGRAFDLGLFRNGKYADESDERGTWRCYQKIDRLLDPSVNWGGHYGDPAHWEMPNA